MKVFKLYRLFVGLLIGLLLCLLPLSSCYKKEEIAAVADSKQYHIRKMPADFKIPKKIFDEIVEPFSKESKTLTPVFVFVPVVVKLHSLQTDVVIDNNVTIHFPNGGGAIDLNQFIKKQGSFFMSFPEEQFKLRPPIENIFFISQYKERLIDDEKFGLGCGKWTNLTGKNAQLTQTNFLKLNNTDLRHLAVVGGQFIFVSRVSNQFYLTHLSVMDSSHPELLCENNSNI